MDLQQYRQAQKSPQIVNFSIVSLLFLGLFYIFVCNEANVEYLIFPSAFQQPQFLTSSNISHAATVSTYISFLLVSFRIFSIENVRFSCSVSLISANILTCVLYIFAVQYDN